MPLSASSLFLQILSLRLLRFDKETLEGWNKLHRINYAETAEKKLVERYDKFSWAEFENGGSLTF